MSKAIISNKRTRMTMKQSFILHILVFVLLSSTTLLAQPVRTNTVSQMLETAEESAAKGDYFNAAEWYEKAYKEEKNYDLVPVIADALFKVRNYSKAAKYYERLFKREKDNEFLHLRLPYAQNLKRMGDYQAALDQFALFLSFTEDEAARAVAVYEVEGINSYTNLAENVEVEIKPGDKNLNYAGAESRPIEYTDGTLYFSSFKTNKKLDFAEVEEDYHMKIYTSQMSGDTYGKASALRPSINRDDYHTSNPCFSPDGREMYFTRSIIDDAQIISSKLFVSYAKDDGWKPPLELETVNGDWIAKNPCVGELYGKRVLIFSADMEGGYGGFDLYYSTIEGEGNYASPVNMGETINTSGDEVTPFYQDGNLYYSTDGLPTIGGFDIFKTVWDGVSWSAPMNMGKNYNSSLDDLYLSFSKEGNRGYLVSNRPYDNKRKIENETCCDDIFIIKVRELVIDLQAIVNDENGPLNGATVTLTNLSQLDNEESKTETTTNNFNFLLDQEFKYKVVVSRDGYYPDSLEFNTFGIIDDFTVDRSFTLKAKPVEVKEPTETIETVTINQPIRMNNIYYDYDDDKILFDAEKDLSLIEGLMEKYPDMKIELASHTDSRGRDRYNEKLSQRRAESAKAWLVNRGVDPNRIVAKGYGETKIINQCANGVLCSDEQHRVNRRTEFTIIEGPTTIEIVRPIEKTSTREYRGGRQSFGLPSKIKVSDSFPIMSFKDDNLNIGEVEKGKVTRMLYEFENTGNAPLIIELVTACKCTELEWTRGEISPGEKGEIIVAYDSKDDVGEVKKTIDIIANTDPIVVEVFFEATVVDEKK